MDHGGPTTHAQAGRADAERRAIAAWRGALGDAAVLTDAASRAPFERATFATARRIVAVLRPVDAAKVRECVRIAAVHGVPLYPVSRGRNWGLGSAVPASDGNAVLDLGLLDRITHYDGRLGTITLEPGVTFQQVHQFLRDQQSDFYLPPIGGPAGASVIGNALERGDTTGPEPDRWAAVTSLEIVLASGDVLRTGFARHGHSALARLGGAPPGPLVEGLFAQSNLGIITSATLRLTPRPAVVQLMSCQIGTAARVDDFLEALRPLILSGAVPPVFTLWNIHKLMARAGPYPWEQTGGVTPLRLPVIDWLASAQIPAASPALAAAQRELIARALEPVCVRLQFVDGADNPALRNRIDALAAPSDENVRSLYWRKKGSAPAPPDMDPNRDRCGAHWICLAAPFDGKPVAEALAIAETLLLDHGFEPIIGFHTHTGRVLYGYVVLVYDRDVDGEDARALACHDALLDALSLRGIEPYRLGIQSMDRLAACDAAHVRLLHGLKSLLDPDGIIAPGRYDGTDGSRG